MSSIILQKFLSHYKTLILRLVGLQKTFGVFGSIISVVALGYWGYHAGGILGGIIFAIMGVVFGFITGMDLPNALIQMIGTFKRLIFAISMVVLVLIVKTIFKDLPIGPLLFALLYLYILWITRWATPIK